MHQGDALLNTFIPERRTSPQVEVCESLFRVFAFPPGFLSISLLAPVGYHRSVCTYDCQAHHNYKKNYVCFVIPISLQR